MFWSGLMCLDVSVLHVLGVIVSWFGLVGCKLHVSFCRAKWINLMANGRLYGLL